MDIAGRYLVSMKYAEIKPFMLLSPVAIEGWMVNGERLYLEEGEKWKVRTEMLKVKSKKQWWDTDFT